MPLPAGGEAQAAADGDAQCMLLYYIMCHSNPKIMMYHQSVLFSRQNQKKRALMRGGEGRHGWMRQCMGTWAAASRLINSSSWWSVPNNPEEPGLSRWG